MTDLSLFAGNYKDKRVFLTGHTGFKGSWLAFWLEKMGAKVFGYSRSPSTHPNHFDLSSPNIQSCIGDLQNFTHLKSSIEAANPDIVFHLAAQALVIPSYEDPVDTYTSNLVGTLHLLEACRTCPNLSSIVCITTDKVYENFNRDEAYKEEDTLGGYDPYAASKACVEILVKSHRNSYFKPDDYGNKHNVLIGVARAGNVIGGGDWSDYRLIPDLVKATESGKKAVIRNPQSIRPWQHVLESLSGYLLLGQKLIDGGKSFATHFNFGPDDDDHLEVGTVVRQMAQHWNKIDVEINTEAKKFYEQKILKLDCTKAHQQLSWKPVWKLPEALKHTALWYKSYYETGNINTASDIDSFVAKAKEFGLPWVS